MSSMFTGCGKKTATVKDTSVPTNIATDTTSDADKTTDSNVTKTTDVQNTSKSTTDSQTVQNNTTKTAVIVKQQDQSFYGQWKINKLIAFGPVSIYGNEDVRKMVGKTISYSDAKAVYGTVTCETPYYKKENISMANFETSNKMKFSRLGITAKSIDRFTVYTSSSSNNLWDSTGSVFYVKDQSTLILFDGGAYFELVKVTS